MDPDDYYVHVLDAADAWYDLVEQEEEPSTADWDAAHDALALAVEAMQEYEALHGKGRRAEPWGGLQVSTFAVIAAAEAWCESAAEEEPVVPDDEDPVLEQLGSAIAELRVAEAAR